MLVFPASSRQVKILPWCATASRLRTGSTCYPAWPLLGKEGAYACDANRPGPNDRWEYCRACDCRHRPLTLCPKSCEKESEHREYCYRCGRQRDCEEQVRVGATDRQFVEFDLLRSFSAAPGIIMICLRCLSILGMASLRCWTRRATSPDAASDTGKQWNACALAVCDRGAPRRPGPRELSSTTRTASFRSWCQEFAN